MRKFGHSDARPILERASARETAARVALGEVARRLLHQVLGIEILSHVVALGQVRIPGEVMPGPDEAAAINADPVRCFDANASAAMVAEIDAAKKAGDTLGGVVEVLAFGLPPGLGSFTHWDRRLDARLRQHADVHPGHQGRRGRRRLHHRGPARVGGPRRDRGHAAGRDQAYQPGGRHRGRDEHPVR